MRRITHLYGSAHFTIPLMGVGGRGLVESVKKGKFVTKIFFR